MLLRLRVLRRGVTRGNHVGQPQWLGGTNSAVNTVLKALSSVGGIRHQRSFLHTSSTSLAASGHKDIYGVPFEVMPNQVDSLFRHWCEQKTPFLRIPEYQYYAYYVPFWSYDIGAEFTDGSRQQYHHDSQSMVYGGYTFRRSMVEVLKSGRHQRQQLFNNNLLNIGVSVNIDVWTVYDNLAWDVACGTIEQSAGRQLRDAIEYEVEKVMIPAYVVEYKHLGEVWRVFINGVTGESFGFEQKGILATIYRTVSILFVDFEPKEAHFTLYGFTGGHQFTLHPAIWACLCSLAVPPSCGHSSCHWFVFPCLRATASCRPPSARVLVGVGTN